MYKELLQHAHSGLRWVAVGGAGGSRSAAFSSDGISWTNSSSNPFATLGRGVAWSAGLGSVNITNSALT